MTEKPKPEQSGGFRDKLGPIPPENFDNDFPPGELHPPKGKNPAVDALREHVEKETPKPKR